MDNQTKLDSGWGKLMSSKANKVVAVAVLILFAYMVFYVLFGGGREPQQIKQEATDVRVGDEAYLRLSSTTDPEQIILLAINSENAFDQLIKALLANDTQGIIELVEQGKVFGVSNGTRVFVIDSGIGKRKVRILQGLRPVDQDKIGRTGWVVKEQVVK